MDLIRYFLLTGCLLIGGCGFFGKKEPQTGPPVTVAAAVDSPETEITVPDEETPAGLTYREFDDFYLALPEMGLPLGCDDEEYDNRVSVSEVIYRSPWFDFDYDYDGVEAARLPEVDGNRFVIITGGDTGGFITRQLYTFRPGEPGYADKIQLYQVREIDGGENTLVSCAEIGNDMSIELTTTYFGNGPGGEFARIIFRHEYFAVSPDGTIGKVVIPGKEVIAYTEPEDTVFGESYPAYNFSVTHYRPALTEEEEVWELHEYKTIHYTVNDESWLVEVDGFDR